MSEAIDNEIRRSLEAEALAYEPPDHLAGDTLAAVETSDKPGLFGRVRGLLDSRGLRREGGVPKLAFAGMALAVLVGLYGVGYMSIGRPQFSESSRVPNASSPVTPDQPYIGEKGGMPQSDRAEVPPSRPGLALPESGTSVPATEGNGGGGTAGDDASAKRSAQGPAVSGSAPADTIAPGPPIPRPAPGGIGAPGQGVIRTGEMEVRVRKGGFGSAWSRAMGIAAKHGGYVAGSSADQVKGRLSRGTITVRVPAASLDAAVADFQRLGRLMRSTSSSSDVSGQLVDYDARIRAAQAREMQLLELLRQARSVGDSLQVGTALSEVRTEIESLQAQRQSLQDQVEFAALTVSIYEPEAAPERPRPAGGRLSNAWERALDAGATTLSTIVIGAGFVLPLAALAALVWGGFRLRRRLAIR